MKRVLLVDDNPDFSDLIRDVLVRQGYEVSCAGDGPEALRALGVDPPGECGADLVLMDLYLPGLSGKEIYDRMLADPKAGLVPVIFLSGDSNFPEGPRARGLKKPFDPARMLELIKELAP